MSEMADAIRALAAEKGISEDSIRQTIETTIRAAYKKTFKYDDNCIVKFADDMSDVYVYSRKTVIDGVYDPIHEIELEEAKELAPEAEEGDELDIQIDPHNFERSAVTTGKQTAHQNLSESFKDNLLNEYKSKIGQVIIGYCQREKNKNYFVDLGKVEGFLPVKNQNPRETYEQGDRIKALVVNVKKNSSGIQLELSRSDPKFVESLVEFEIPEIQDGIVKIYKTVREASYRTKIAVYSDKMDIDPVGACVGLKGVRIQNVIREIEGEKIDILKYEEDPHKFIANALSPATVKNVIVTDPEHNIATAIVEDDKYALAIGKNGLNVRLANKLCDWVINVVTESEAQGMDLVDVSGSRKAADELFAGSENAVEAVEPETISELPGVNAEAAAILKENGIDDFQQYVDAIDDGSILNIPGITQEIVDGITAILTEYVEFEDEAAEESVGTSDDQEEEYTCPECGAKITLDMDHCPNCGCELEFEEE